MNQTHGLVTALVRVAQWGLPWLCILMIAGTAAYAMTVAFAHTLPAGDQPMSLAGEQAPATGSATSRGALMASIDPGVDPSAGTVAVSRTAIPDAADLSSDDTCAASGPMLYVGLGTWIHDPSVPCHDDAP